jgi:DNA polymerase (family 10)
MSQPSDVATARLIRAIENPHVDIIGHLTTRLLGKRVGIEFDRQAVFAAAARTGTALEVNAHPARLDLCDADVRLALSAGARLTIDTDAHSVQDLALMDYGVGTARRGGARAADVWNCGDLESVLGWLGRHH